MEFSVKIKSPILAEVHVKANLDDLEKAKEKAYQNFSKKIKVPGFRIGMAPLELIKKQLNEDVVFEEAVKILGAEAIDRIINEANPKPLHIPKLKVEKAEKGKSIEFSSEYEYFPNIQLKKYKKLDVRVPEVIYDSTIVDDIVLEYRKQRPVYLPKEMEDPAKNIVEENNAVLLDLNIIKNKKDIYHKPEYVFYINDSSDKLIPQLKENLLNKKVGDEIEYSTKFPENKFFKKASNKEVIVKAKILEIRYPTEPEVNDEFAHYMGFESLDAMKDFITKKLKSQIDNYEENTIFEGIIKEIINKNHFEIPEYLLDRYFDEILKKIEYDYKQLDPRITVDLGFLAFITNRKEEDVEKEIRETALYRARQDLIIKWIVENENLNASDEEIDKKILEMFQSDKINQEEKQKYLKNVELREKIENMIVNQKLVNFFIRNNDIKKDEKISVKKLYKEGVIKI